jgi:hypothetical protein
MDPETVRTITTSAITAISTLGAASIAAYVAYRTQKLSNRTTELRGKLEKRTRELIKAYRQVSAYYQLEQEYSAELSAKTGHAQKTLKSQFRKTVEEKNFDKPTWTTTDCNRDIEELETE